MQKLTRIYLPISCLLLFLSFGCRSKITDNYTLQNVAETNISVPYFSDSQKDYVYKTNITIYGHELSGIFIAKKINDSGHRVVFTTEFGNKLLDFEIYYNTFKVNSIVAELNKKMIINTLTNDFRLLLKEKYTFEKTFVTENYTIHQTADGKQFDYIYVTNEKNTVEKIVQGTERKKKITLTFTPENDTFANKIIIEHHNIKLKIELNHLQSE